MAHSVKQFVSGIVAKNAALEADLAQAEAERDEWNLRADELAREVAKAVEGLREIVRVGAYEPEGAALVDMVRSILAEIEGAK